jgi:7,8-dihydropterin-6-yl-methyl-4-(beta-D-ribofuranosyl)aminobenzene 5'-phosphate synthase
VVIDRGVAMRRSLLVLAVLTLAVVGSSMGLGQSGPASPAPNSPRELQALKVTILSTMLASDGMGEWGFAALVEVDGKRVLFDTGARPDTVLENAKELEVDLSGVQDVILSHFHGDHTRGLVTLRRELSKSNPSALSRVHVGKGVFLARRGSSNPLIVPNPMTAIKRDYEATGGQFIEHAKPAELLPGVWVTGPVPRLYPEKNYPEGIEVATGDGWVADEVSEDQSLVFNTPRGLILLAGCGHAGIINTLEYARKFVRPAPATTVLGGFHLYDATDAQVDWTADKLKEFRVAQILGAHCTGIESLYRLRQRLGLNRQSCAIGSVGASFDLKDGIHTDFY